MYANLQEIEAYIETHNSSEISPNILELSQDLFEYIERTNKNTANTPDNEHELIKCLNLFEKICCVDSNDSILPLFSTRLNNMGMEAYKVKKYEISEVCFRILSHTNSDSYKNNFAYVLRRGEISSKNNYQNSEIMLLLRDGVKNQSGFSITNMALLLALNCKDEESWKLAYDLMKLVTGIDVVGVANWWEDVGNDGDIEGVLVHYFFLRHDKITESVFGNQKKISKKLSAEIEHFPTWLTIESKFNSLDDVFETIMDDDFDETLTNYLDNMPRNRESTAEILEKMTQWDEWKLYKVLLQEFIEFLTQDEIAKTIRAYKKIFSIPLSSIMDERDFKIIDEGSSED